MGPLPRVRSFLLADLVFRQDTGKWCLVGVFDKIRSAAYPVMHPSLGLYLQLSDAQGEYEVAVEFQDAQGARLGRFEGLRLRVPDRLSIAEIGVQTQQLPIPAPGTYFLKLFFDGRPADADIRLTAEIPSRPPPRA